MRYELILQGDMKLVVSDIEAKSILAAVNNKTEIIEIGETRFRYSMFKGLFPIPDEIDGKVQWIKENKWWDEKCQMMSKLSIDEKTNVEFSNRILPGLKLAKIDLPDELYEPMKANVMQFFKDNPNYPRCPMRIWWPFVRAKIALLNKKTKKRPNPNMFLSKWWEYILRNDNAIQEWLQYHNL